MNIKTIQNGIVIENVKDFDLTHTFLCGQCFRWNEDTDGSFTGVAGGHAIKIKSHNNNITLFNTNLQEFNEFWVNYFDLNRDYGSIKSSLAIDDIMKRATSYGFGIRILKQDTFETLLSFIISASNNISRIKQIIQRLCERYGDKIYMEGKTYYSFPTPEQLQGVSAEDLDFLRAGYRAKYLADAINKVSSGEFDIERVKTLSLSEAKAELLKIKGVGHKVADCILLFGMERFGVFPVDTWIKRAMSELYPNQCETAKTIREAGENIFGEYCGLAQQYIFYYARDNKLFK